MTTPNAELIAKARRIVACQKLDKPENMVFNLAAFVEQLCIALAAADARAAELERDDEKSARDADTAWIAGARFGWNCAVEGADEILTRAIENRQNDIRESRVAARSAP